MTNTPAEPSCQVCGKSGPRITLSPAGVISPAVAAAIRKEHPAWSEDGFICSEDLRKFRSAYMASLLEAEKGEITALEEEVLSAMASHETVAENLETGFQQNTTFGERLSDRLASFGGSWKFILAFASVLVVWIIINSVVLLFRPFDPYPFILLNLILSCLAAIQAPVIMMSQNRQEAKDRLRALHDYQVNLKAELEIRHLHEKVDHLLKNQWERLVEIQNLQLDILNEMRDPEVSKGKQDESRASLE
jgi:uncharacterized membrane protein